MKRKLLIAVLVLSFVLVLAGCGCEHEWTEADCVTPKTCSLCEQTEGAPLGHSWKAATCTVAKTCEVCSATEGEALGHTWEDATCLIPKKCSVCHELQGDPLGHSWEDATTDAPKTCTACQATEGSKLDVDSRFTTASTKHLYGKWTCEVTLTGDILGMPGYFESVPCTFSYEFGKTGEVTMNVEIHDRLAFMDELKKMMTDITYDSLEQQGIKKEDADTAMMMTYGMTTEQYINLMVDSVDLDEIFEAFTQDGVYYVSLDSKEIFLSDSWYGDFESSDYTLENDVLIIEEDKLEEDGEPLKWNKVKE